MELSGVAAASWDMWKSQYTIYLEKFYLFSQNLTYSFCFCTEDFCFSSSQFHIHIFSVEQATFTASVQ